MNRVWHHHFHIGIIATVELKQSSSAFSFYTSLLFPPLCCITVRWECLHTDCERGKKKVDFHRSSACRLHAGPGNDILLKAVGGKRDWKIILSLLFFCLFVFPPASPLAVPFSLGSNAKACRQKNCLAQRYQLLIIFCKLISKPDARTSYSGDKADYLRSSWTPQDKLCLVLPPNIRQTEMTLVLLEPVAASPKL